MIKIGINGKKTLWLAHKLPKFHLHLQQKIPCKKNLMKKGDDDASFWWIAFITVITASLTKKWRLLGRWHSALNEWSVSHRCDAADGMPLDKQTVEVRRWAGLLCRHKSHFFPGAQRHKKSMASRTNRLFRWSVKRNFFLGKNENFFHQRNFPTKKSTKRWTFWHTQHHMRPIFPLCPLKEMTCWVISVQWAELMHILFDGIIFFSPFISSKMAVPSG